jgi:hypothetical protein
MGQSVTAAYNSRLKNCTVISNSDFFVNAFSTLTNCIVYYNAEVSISAGVWSYCCVAPLPSGTGNFTNAPQLFADGVHLLGTSPCIGAGTNLVTGTDIFGQVWSNPPAIGCAEYNPAPVVTEPTIILTGNPVGFAVNVAAASAGPLSFYWFKDGVPLQDNGPFTDTQTTNLEVTSVSVAEAGDFQCVASNAFGMTTSAVVTLAIHCVDAAGTNPEPPYLTWATAATNIQDAIDASEKGDIVLVTNGLYNNGGISEDGVITNRITLETAIRVQSVNGPWATSIEGAGATNGTSAVRCAWLTTNAILIGFTLEDGATRSGNSQQVSANGGAVWCASSNAVVDNCVIRSNTAYATVVYQGSFNNCLISSNGAEVVSAVLNSCTVVSNAGEARGCTLTNCIIYYNEPFNLGQSVSVAYCCTTPSVTGTSNFTSAPDLQPDGVHLASGSPCIGAGTNLVIGTDIFGVAWNNPPSVGCAEYVSVPTVGQPQILLTGAGFSIGNATLTGQAPLSLEWLLNGVSLQSNATFSGAETANLAATGVSVADAGSYQLVVSNAFGAVTSAVVQLAVHTVDAAGVNPVPPFTSWATAATNIQDAIEASSPGDIVLVTNGIYATGGEVMAGGLTNRVALDRAVEVMSVNGHSAAVIQGAWDPVSTNGPAAVRCAWLTNGAVLRGFTLQNGATANTGDDFALQSGGGVWCASTNALVANCVISNNFANYGGGGIISGTLNNSLVVLNVAAYGGGAYNANLNNCTVQANYTTVAYSERGAGTYGGFVRNSIVIGNFDGYPYLEGIDNYAPVLAGPLQYFYCCSYDSSGEVQPGSGIIVSDPLLLDWYHISIISACRGAGSALYASGTDLDGEPWNDPPSIGCDEVVVSNRVGPLAVTMMPFETNVLVSSETVPHVDSFFGTITGLATYLSWDFGDGPAISNADNSVGHYWTNVGDYNVVFTAYNVDHPTDVSTSQVIHVLPINPPQLQPPVISSNTIQFQFTMQEGANYFVQYATNLSPPVTWTTLQSIYDNFGGTMTVQDSATNAARFYRVQAQ